MKSFIRALKSAAAAFIGIQTKNNMEKDFESPSPIHFIIAGLILTALFIALLVTGIQFSLR